MGTRTILADAVLVTTQTTGTGTYSLGNALTGHFHPADVPITSGSRISYTVVDSLTAPTMRETGEGVLSSGSPWTLTRATIRRSLNGGVASGSAINWPVGTRYLYVTPLAANTPQYDTDNSLRAQNTAKAWASFNGTALNDSHAARRQYQLPPTPLLTDRQRHPDRQHLRGASHAAALVDSAGGAARSRARLASPSSFSRTSAPPAPTSTRSTRRRMIRACSAGNSSSQSGSSRSSASRASSSVMSGAEARAARQAPSTTSGWRSSPRTWAMTTPSISAAEMRAMAGPSAALPFSTDWLT